LRSSRRQQGDGVRVLILVENLPVERDPRVRRECAALISNGFEVSVICPRGSGVAVPGLERVAVHTYPAPPESRSALSFIWEFAYSWVMTAILTLKLWLTEPFNAIQACNPPDTLFAIAVPYRLVGIPFVFDHHDLTPEVFTARYGVTSGPIFRLLQALERATFAAASHVIATNESFRQIALRRGGKRPEEVTVVRNGPELRAWHSRASRPELLHGRSHLCVWLGTMFVDDGVELALRAVASLVHDRGREDCHFSFIGDGQKRREVLALADDLAISDWVSFPGWIPLEEAYDYLATAQLGLSPNPKSPRLDVSTSMKVMEYMAFSLPVVAFDVDETRASAGPAAVYATGNDPTRYGQLIDELLNDPARREQMGEEGRTRIENGLSWEHQQQRYVEVYRRLLGAPTMHRPSRSRRR
jgi:glycosyltransferase involved in cell wall biosynthesis